MFLMVLWGGMSNFIDSVLYKLDDTAISRKGCWKNVYMTIPKGNIGYDQYTIPNDCGLQTYFCCFSLAFANVCPWPPNDPCHSFKFL